MQLATRIHGMRGTPAYVLKMKMCIIRVLILGSPVAATAAAWGARSTCEPLTGSFVTLALCIGSSCERVSLSSSPTCLNLTLVQTLLIHFHLLLKTSPGGGISLTGIPHPDTVRYCVAWNRYSRSVFGKKKNWFLTWACYTAKFGVKLRASLFYVCLLYCVFPACPWNRSACQSLKEGLSNLFHPSSGLKALHLQSS